MSEQGFEIFLVAVPGLEAALAAEARERGFAKVRVVPGGVTIKGRWIQVWRANLELRGASRVLARVAVLRADHLKTLEVRAGEVPWAKVLRPDVGVRVEASCANSRIYHSGAAAERIGNAIARVVGARVEAQGPVTIKARIENDVVTLAVDTTGEPLHKRGHKQAVAKAPMRETMAALFLRECGYDGREPVLDPMCGSGTFVIEAAEMALGLLPGRARHFAFEQLATFDRQAWSTVRASASNAVPDIAPGLHFTGSDTDAGAIRMSRANAERAGVSALTDFVQCDVSEIAPPDGPSGLVITNPPYGARIGERSRLLALYRTLGETLRQRFSGWRVGLVTSDADLARATRLPFEPPGPPVLHGGLRITLWRTRPLP